MLMAGIGAFSALIAFPGIWEPRNAAAAAGPAAAAEGRVAGLALARGRTASRTGVEAPLQLVATKRPRPAAVQQC